MLLGSVARAIEVEDVTYDYSGLEDDSALEAKYGGGSLWDLEHDHRLPDHYSKRMALFSTQTPECNFFTGRGLVQPPWPQGCRVYQEGVSCNKYEISRDGKHVHSC